ncbi:hypothetical protein T492DRAFT_1144333 [Pavlovales sp. CCMP2436]|nr:hypothetical protein T492DRAFT_1144333 [Pavlovales sp. CCMP2436]
MVSAALVVGLQLQAMNVQVGLLLIILMLKPPPRVPVDRSDIFAAYYDKSANVFLTDVGLTHWAFDEVLRRIEPRIKREYTLKGHGGSLEPGLKLMIALRWLRGSRMSDFKDIVNSTAKKALWEVMGALVEGCGDALQRHGQPPRCVPDPGPVFWPGQRRVPNKHGFLTGYWTKASGAEDAFSYAHSVHRQSVECTFGQWFARWPRIKFGLDCKLRNAYTIIEAAAILLNVCIDEHLQTHWFAPDAEAGDADLPPPLPRHELHLDGDSVGMDAAKYQALLRKLPRADPRDGSPCPELETQERGTAEFYAARGRQLRGSDGSDTVHLRTSIVDAYATSRFVRPSTRNNTARAVAAGAGELRRADSEEDALSAQPSALRSIQSGGRARRRGGVTFQAAQPIAPLRTRVVETARVVSILDTLERAQRFAAQNKVAAVATVVHQLTLGTPPPSIWRAPSLAVLQLLESVQSLPDTRHNAKGVALALLPSDPSLLVVSMHRGDHFGGPRPDVHGYHAPFGQDGLQPDHAGRGSDKLAVR